MSYLGPSTLHLFPQGLLLFYLHITFRTDTLLFICYGDLLHLFPLVVGRIPICVDSFIHCCWLNSHSGIYTSPCGQLIVVSDFTFYGCICRCIVTFSFILLFTFTTVAFIFYLFFYHTFVDPVVRWLILHSPFSHSSVTTLIYVDLIDIWLHSAFHVWIIWFHFICC